MGKTEEKRWGRGMNTGCLYHYFQKEYTLLGEKLVSDSDSYNVRTIMTKKSLYTF